MFTGECSQSQTEGQLEMVLPGLRLWAQRGSFFLLLVAELTGGGAGLPPPSLMAHLKHSLLRDLALGFLSLLPMPTDAGYQQTEDALFTIFLFYLAPAKRKVRVFKKIVCHFI